MVGTIKKITLDKAIADVDKEINRIIDSKSRIIAGETAPAKGLFLNKILFYQSS